MSFHPRLSWTLRAARTVAASVCAWLPIAGWAGPTTLVAKAEQHRQHAMAPGAGDAVTVVSPGSAPASVCFFAQPDFAGASFCASGDGAAMPRGFDNKVSSVRVPAGLGVKLFDGTAGAGRSVSLTGDVARLATMGFDAAASSFTIAPTGSSWPIAQTVYWSDPATWGGKKPAAGSAVVVPAGTELVLDEDTASLGPLTVLGTLRFRDGVTAELQASVILIPSGGELLAGSPTSRFTGRATITLTDADADADPTGTGMGTRGILVHGGRVALFGNPPVRPWTRLAEDAPAGATSLRLAADVNWQEGDQLVVAPTEWYPLDPEAPQKEHDAATTTERRTLAAAASRTVTLASGLAAFKWGSLQYVTDDGLSLKPGKFTPPHPDTVNVIDERAEVGNLTRNIVIRGPADSLWKRNGFGAQVMVMGLASRLQLDGVELRQVGQAGVVGRYPIHFHLLSYAPDGRELGDVTDTFVRNSVVWNSSQRCIVIHATSGVRVQDNICYDIRGHAIFLEDGVERRNVIEGNLVLRVRSPAESQLTQQHERRGSPLGCGGGASGFWLTNPDNTVRNNAAADAQGNGFWLSYPKTPIKQSAKVKLMPMHLVHGPFEFNSARSNGHFGVMLECVLADDAGRTVVGKYAPTQTGQPFDYNNGKRFTLRGLTIAKNRSGGYLNRTSLPDYRQLVLSGNLQRSVTGAVDAGTLKHSLIVARSLNDRQPMPPSGDPQLGIASYHSQMDIAENAFIGFANRGYVLARNGWDKSSGTFGTDDYYIRPVEKGYWRNPKNLLIDSDPGYRALPPHMQGNYAPSTRNSWTLSGALWDPHGVAVPAGRYWVLDAPFLRDASCAPVVSRHSSGSAGGLQKVAAVGSEVSSRGGAGKPNGLSCAGPYYGVLDFALNRGMPGATERYRFMEQLDVTRVGAGGAEVGRWVVEQGYDSSFLGHMRHFAAVKGTDAYIVRFPKFPNASKDKTAPRWVHFVVENLREPGDQLLLGVHYAGGVMPGRVYVSTAPDHPNFSGSGRNAALLSPAPSREAVLAGKGNLYWQDKAGDLVWLKLTPWRPGEGWNGVAPGSDTDLYRPLGVRIEP